MRGTAALDREDHPARAEQQHACADPEPFTSTVVGRFERRKHRFGVV